MGARPASRSRGVRGAGGPRAAFGFLSDECDDVIVLETPASFRAVGEWYERFDQVTDREVLDALEAGPWT